MKAMYLSLLVALTISGTSWTFPTRNFSDSRLDPGVLKALEISMLGLRATRLGPNFTLPAKPGLAPVVVELDSEAVESTLVDLERAGLVIFRADKKRLFYKRFVPGFVDEDGIAGLLTLSEVVRIAPSLPRAPLPLDLSAELIARDAGWGARPAVDLLTGRGVTVADLDSNVDVFHPHFFRGDGGYYDWMDVNDNGIFEPAIDVVDLDRDGVADEDETAEHLRAEMVEGFTGSLLDARDGDFDPAVDWVFLDSNGNGVRDFGAEGGFDDSAPALGEPLFVPDDVNVSGTLDPGERLIRLGSSKFKKIYVETSMYPLPNAMSRVFERGVDLAEHRSDLVGSIYGYAEALHSTGVLSILAGDLPLAGRRFVGVVPEADLLLGFELANLPAVSLAWALGENPDVVLHELAPWTGEVLDGTDAYSAMVDESTLTDNISHSCPVGNTGGARKHARLEVSGVEKSLDFVVPGSLDMYYIELSINIVGEVPESILVRGEGEVEISLLGDQKQILIAPKIYAYISDKMTSKGTQFYNLAFYSQSGSLKEIVGSWSLVVTAATGKQFTLDAYLMDSASGWSEGVAFDETVASDDRTIGIPATSESCIAIGAFTAHWNENGDEPWYAIPGEHGHVRYFSGRGPTVDGRPKPDVVAPDNPWAATPHGVSLMDTIPHGAVAPFGGTSGAGPHVAGVAAMLAEAGIRGADAKQAITEGATVDEITGEVPNSDYGWGRLNAAGAFKTSQGGQKPKVILLAEPEKISIPGEVLLSVQATDEDSGKEQLEVKWDDGYDGLFDLDYGDTWERTVNLSEPGRYPFKVRVRDEGGLFAEAVVWVTAEGEDLDTDTEGDGGFSGTDEPSDGGQYMTAVSGGGCSCTGVGHRPDRGSYLWLLWLSLVGERAEIIDGFVN